MPVNTIDTIEPKNAGAFPVVRDIDIQGGIQVQPTTAARDAIPLNNQKVGMVVYVTANSTYYQLTATGAPGTWVAANLGSTATLAGDVTGTSGASTVAKIRGVTVSTNSVANDGYALVSIGGQYVPAGLAPKFNVKNFGAKGDGVTNDSAAIQAAINIAEIQGGGTVYFPPGIYAIASSLLLGSHSPGVGYSGVVLEAGRRNLSGDAILKWTGASGGNNMILEIRQAHSCSITNLGFNGNNLADYCIQWHLVPGDNLQCEHFVCTGLYYQGARKYNVLIGEPDGYSSIGDVSEVLHLGCYFQQSSANTIAHVRHRSSNALDNSFINCQFYGNDIYPQNAVYISSGSVMLHDCVTTVLGQVDFLMDNDPGIQPGSLFISGLESQSRRLLFAQPVDNSNTIRSTTLLNVAHDDIENHGDGYCIAWGFQGAPLNLIGCTFQTNNMSFSNVFITNQQSNVYTLGTAFDVPGVGFTGFVEKVSGTYRDGYSRMITLNTQESISSWGANQLTNTSAVVHGSGGTFGSMSNGEFVDISVNGLPSVRTIFTNTDTTAVLVADAIAASFPNSPNFIQTDPRGSFTQLRMMASQSIQIVGGSVGTLSKIGLVVGTTNSLGPYPLATLEGKQQFVDGYGILSLGDDQLSGLLIVSFNTGVGTGGSVGLFNIQGLAHTLDIISDTKSFCTVNNSSHAGTVNLYWDNTSNQYLLKNNFFGDDLFISISLVGIGQH